MLNSNDTTATPSASTERHQAYEDLVGQIVDVVERYKLARRQAVGSRDHRWTPAPAGEDAGHTRRLDSPATAKDAWLVSAPSAQRWMRLAEANVLTQTITHFGGVSSTLEILGHRVDLFKAYDGDTPRVGYLVAVGKGMVVQARIEAEVGLAPEASFKDEHVAVFWRIFNLLGDADTEERPHIYGQMRHGDAFDQAGG